VAFPLATVLAIAAALGGLAVAQAADAPETDSEILAAAVRSRGLPCDEPRDVERDPQASLPDRPAWTVRCAQARYRVIYEGDASPRVDVLQ